MKDVIDVQAREKPKFLTGTPRWMERWPGVLLALFLLGCLIAAIL